MREVGRKGQEEGGRVRGRVGEMRVVGREGGSKVGRNRGWEIG